MILAVLVMAALGAGYLAVSSGRQGSTSTLTSPGAPTSTTLSEGPLVFISPISEQGLQLRVALNSSVLHANGTLGAQISVYNTLDKNVSVTVTENQEISGWNGEDFLLSCYGQGNLAGFAVFEGDVAASNLSKAGPPLELDPQVYPYIVLGCPTQENFPVNATFFPEGDRVSYAYGVTASITPKTFGCEYTDQQSQCTGTGLVGYWNNSVSTGGNLGFNSPAFVHFPPGEYTIVATDDWNQTVYATFVVESPAMVATVTLTTTTITQASRPTTIYAIPVSCPPTTAPTVTTTTTVTTTYGASSTTTVTVTETSTTYSQTSTITTCTYIMPTVTSTVTSTANP